MKLDKDKLYKSCSDLAKVVCLAQDEEINEANVRSKSSLIMDTALRYVTSIENRGGDPNIVSRAITYLSNTQTFTLQKTSMDTYFMMLEVLLEIAYPNYQQSTESSEFLSDLDTGIKLAKKEIKK